MGDLGGGDTVRCCFVTVLVQVLLVSSSVVSAWHLVSHAGLTGVLGCPVC
jgi:hypothetical protein